MNTAENFPGVATPLGWSFWERALRGAFCDLGALRPSEVHFPPSVDDRCSGVFFGRFTANLSTLLRFADRMPGASGAAFEEQMFGGSSWTGRAVWQRYPVVAVKMPATALRLSRRLRSLRAEIDRWWRAVTAPGALDDPARAPGRHCMDATRNAAQLRLAAVRLRPADRAHLTAGGHSDTSVTETVYRSRSGR